MSKTVQVKVGGGVVLRVKQGFNAANMVTGRVNGKTYEGVSWQEVERKITADYSDDRQWTRYLVIRARDPKDPVMACSYAGRSPARTAEVDLNFMVLEATQVVHSDGQPGVFSRRYEGDPHPQFHRGATSAEDALELHGQLFAEGLGWGAGAYRVLVWSEAMEASLIGMCEAIDDLARRIADLVKAPEFARALLGGKLTFALPEASTADTGTVPRKGRGQ